MGSQLGSQPFGRLTMDTDWRGSSEIMPLASKLVRWGRVMRRSRFAEDQIIGVLREHDTGLRAAGKN